MVNPRRNEGFTSREIVPTQNEYARPAIPEPIVGDYYYGRPPTKSAIARVIYAITRPPVAIDADRVSGDYDRRVNVGVDSFHLSTARWRRCW